MNYRNGQDIFPEQLLKQIQRYVSGETIYIPASDQKKKAWGESSGYRAYLAKRNQSIKDDFAGGFDIDSLADKYCLSVDSVKHIVYTKKETPMLEYNKTLSSALSYAKENKIDREGKAKNCFRNFFNALLLNTGRQRPYTCITLNGSSVLYISRSFGFSILPVGLRGTGAKMILRGRLYFGSSIQKLFTSSSVQV